MHITSSKTSSEISLILATSNALWEFQPYTKTIHRKSYPGIDPKNPANSADGKAVVVTGGGAGIGKGIAKAFVQAGAKAVTILGRREILLAEAKKELENERSSKILYFVADISDKVALGKAFEANEKEVGKVDIVVANAGYMSDQALAATTDVADWWKSFEVNIKGTLLTFQAFMAHKGDKTPTFISVNTGAAHAGIFLKFSVVEFRRSGKLSSRRSCKPRIRIFELSVCIPQQLSLRCMTKQICR